MSSSRFFVTWTVAQAIVIPPLLYVVLDNFQSAEVTAGTVSTFKRTMLWAIRLFVKAPC
jgi:hypothetical protein